MVGVPAPPEEGDGGDTEMNVVSASLDGRELEIRREAQGTLRQYGAVPPKGAPMRVPSSATGRYTVAPSRISAYSMLPPNEPDSRELFASPQHPYTWGDHRVLQVGWGHLKKILDLDIEILSREAEARRALDEEARHPPAARRLLERRPGAPDARAGSSRSDRNSLP